MQPFQVALVPSRSGTLWAVVLHVCALALCLAVFHGTLRWSGVVALAASFVWAWRVQRLRRKNSVRRIEIDTAGRAAITLPGRPPQRACLSESSLIHRRGCFLAWQAGGKTLHHTVLPDMTDAESYRRLIVWARFGRSREEADA